MEVFTNKKSICLLESTIKTCYEIYFKILFDFSKFQIATPSNVITLKTCY